MRGLMGHFAVMPLLEVLELLLRRELTGTLTCERGTVRKTIYVERGLALGAASNDPREYLGQLLMNFGHLTEEQLTKAFSTQEETHVRLGKVLTLAGVVTPEVVKQVLALKIRETLLDALVWDSGVFQVDAAPPPPREELDAAVPLAEVIREADFRATAWRAFRSVFPSGTLSLEVDEQKTARAGELERRLVQLARERRTIDEIGLALHATDFHLYQRLYALHRQGLLRPARAEDAAPAAGTSPTPEPRVASDLVKDGRAHLAAGRAARAEEAAVRALSQDPQDPLARALLAEATEALAADLRPRFLDPPRTPSLKVRAQDLALMRLPAAEKYLLSRCDGTRDLRQIVQLAPIPELEILKAMQKFVEGRIVSLA
ncbi:DUF4388 domain-containing protein [Anaeromyxobacter paludicola]|uniref:PatA-like N-terminal domain-containing protein n=1 Tax=Anaeromyxobacter paludicola TaxID=2918171 RepID=A0ABN6NBI5_9BACT|nr:DUF4388 domain-containing protein [Anaeromyxobacter paludicola]BDG09360.1 hypothetical protein AMPC_24730 [Anaeromyxobacter paludicola]